MRLLGWSEVLSSSDPLVEGKLPADSAAWLVEEKLPADSAVWLV
ncbi:hypothetical protein [Amycolatopsis sp. NPDC004169]